MPGCDEYFDMVVLVADKLLEAFLNNVFEGNPACDHFRHTGELAWLEKRQYVSCDQDAAIPKISYLL